MDRSYRPSVISGNSWGIPRFQHSEYTTCRRSPLSAFSAHNSLPCFSILELQFIPLSQKSGDAVRSVPSSISCHNSFPCFINQGLHFLRSPLSAVQWDNSDRSPTSPFAMNSSVLGLSIPCIQVCALRRTFPFYSTPNSQLARSVQHSPRPTCRRYRHSPGAAFSSANSLPLASTRILQFVPISHQSFLPTRSLITAFKASNSLLCPSILDTQLIRLGQHTPKTIRSSVSAFRRFNSFDCHNTSVFQLVHPSQHSRRIAPSSVPAISTPKSFPPSQHTPWTIHSLHAAYLFYNFLSASFFSISIHPTQLALITQHTRFTAHSGLATLPSLRSTSTNVLPRQHSFHTTRSFHTRHSLYSSFRSVSIRIRQFAHVTQHSFRTTRSRLSSIADSNSPSFLWFSNPITQFIPFSHHSGLLTHTRRTAFSLSSSLSFCTIPPALLLLATQHSSNSRRSTFTAFPIYYSLS